MNTLLITELVIDTMVESYSARSKTWELDSKVDLMYEFMIENKGLVCSTSSTLRYFTNSIFRYIRSKYELSIYLCMVYFEERSNILIQLFNISNTISDEELVENCILFYCIRHIISIKFNNNHSSIVVDVFNHIDTLVRSDSSVDKSVSISEFPFSLYLDKYNSVIEVETQNLDTLSRLDNLSFHSMFSPILYCRGVGCLDVVVEKFWRFYDKFDIITTRSFSWYDPIISNKDIDFVRLRNIYISITTEELIPYLNYLNKLYSNVISLNSIYTSQISNYINCIISSVGKRIQS